MSGFGTSDLIGHTDLSVYGVPAQPIVLVTSSESRD
jgi:hypothetical protein